MVQKSPKKAWNRGIRMAAILALLFGATLLGFQLGSDITLVKAASFPTISMQNVQRLLILAPHPDDETLATGGLILAARQAGIQVRVVLATNGDGSRSTALAYLHAVQPNGQDYLQMGDQRQQESLAALKILGVSSDQVVFLGYPDQGSPSLWTDHWSASTPYTSPFTQQTHSTYPMTYDHKAVYSGQDYLADLKAIINAYQPDLIIYPHPEDTHPDHWGLNLFTRLALARIEQSVPSYRPRQYTYLVHRHDYPVQSGYKPNADLIPPAALYTVSDTWVRLDLAPQQVTEKYSAIQQYRSQLPTLRNLMESFDRSNELFAPVADAQLSTAAGGNPLNPATWTEASGQRISPIQIDPVHDILKRTVVPSSDLVAIYAARSPANTLWLCVKANALTMDDIIYIINLKALTGSGVIAYTAQSNLLVKDGRTAFLSNVYACSQVNLPDLGNPYAIYVGAETEDDGGSMIDLTSWQMVWINPGRMP